jgi:hypothetical protein
MAEIAFCKGCRTSSPRRRGHFLKNNGKGTGWHDWCIIALMSEAVDNLHTINRSFNDLQKR